MAIIHTGGQHHPADPLLIKGGVHVVVGVLGKLQSCSSTLLFPVWQKAGRIKDNQPFGLWWKEIDLVHHSIIN